MASKPKTHAKAVETATALARTRIAIENISHEINGGRFPAKVICARPFRIEADVFGDGHDVLRAAVQARRGNGRQAFETELDYFDNDRWAAELSLPEPGEWQLSFIAWRDLFATWHKDTAKKIAAGHPEWFDWRPDGTIKHAENPPKKYEDIVNVHFYRDALPSLWLELRDVVLFWIEHGVKIFRVDNPHTKPFPFWEWLISDVQARHPDAIFLAEAFTSPKPMKRLAKVGFTQSYSYFTWRHSKVELTEYLTELTRDDCRHYMRPNFFANTPDINPRFLQVSGRPGFRTRLVLAATLAGNYGIYNGFEICEGRPVPGKEEYLDSEKYQLRQWDFDQPGHIKDDIRLINRIRAEHPAMRDFTNLQFYPAADDNVLYYGRMDHAQDSFLLFHVNLDPHAPHDVRFEVPLWEFGLPDDASIEVEDLINGNRFTWHGIHHWLTLDPESRPYAIWRLFPPGGGRI